MNIVVTNCVMSNGGDAAIAIAILRLLESSFGAGCRVTFLDAHATAARRFYPELSIEQQLAFPPTRLPRPFPHTVTRRVWQGYLKVHALLDRALERPLPLTSSHRRAWQALREADLVISTGGTYLTEHYDLTPKILDFRLTRHLGKPLVLFTQSVGSLQPTKAATRRLARELRHARLVMLRDAASLRTLRALGIPQNNLAICSDVVFTLADPTTLRAAAARHLPPDAPRVAISVREWAAFRTGSPEAGMARYHEAIIDLVTWLVRSRGARVEFLSTCQGVGGYRYDDSAVAAEMHERLPSNVRPAVRLERGFHRPEALLARLAEMDFVVATRMHMAILALSAGTPVLPIAYERKTHELFRALGQSDYVADIDDLDGPRLVELAQRYLTDLDATRSTLFERVLQQRDAALGALPLLRRICVEAGLPEGSPAAEGQTS